jgi:hypothetical protein
MHTQFSKQNLNEMRPLQKPERWQKDNIRVDFSEGYSLDDNVQWARISYINSPDDDGEASVSITRNNYGILTQNWNQSW